VTDSTRKDNARKHFGLRPSLLALVGTGVLAIILIVVAVLTSCTPPPTEADLAATQRALDNETTYAYPLQLNIALIGDNIQHIGELLLEVQTDPDLFSDEAWRTELLEAIGNTNDSYMRITELTPPEEFEAFHARIVEAYAACDQAASAVREGLETEQSEAFQRAGQLARECNTAIDEFNDRLAREDFEI